MKVYGYSDEYCTQEVNTNIGVYNDLKVSDPSCCDLLITLLTLNVVLNMSLIELISLYDLYLLNILLDCIQCMSRLYCISCRKR